ncbi:hypothetical protein JCGZ_26449 [Jatropha curcas]|uniref:Uncharacterized protein n=1 Tax=Jatropha curcas TaxID=180498 RepID=A0A067JL14_JATCU|nr:hypothetical protein JCGZ_26449 [Jatropha curcas]
MGRGYYGYAESGLGEIMRSTAEKYGHEPTSMEVFTYPHTKDHDGNTFVDRRALGVNEPYSTARERVVSSQARSEAELRIDDAKEICAIRAYVDAQERQLAELRAHVMRMFGQHGAGTSSFDPPPTIDPHVSTALHQPLSSPLDPDTVDDTLVTPVDTTAHPTDTTAHPADITLDRPED